MNTKSPETNTALIAVRTSNFIS